MNKKRRAFGVSMPPELAHQARVVAARLNMSRSSFVCMAVKQAIRNLEGRADGGQQAQRGEQPCEN